jgi:hypothetical protein
MVDLLDGYVIATAVTIAEIVSLEEMHAQRRMIIRRRRRRRRNVFFSYMLLQADYARALKFEAGLEEEDIRELQIILRTLGNKIGTPTFRVEFRRPYVNMHFLTDRVECKCFSTE